METTEAKTLNTPSGRFRILPLSWIGLTTSILGLWLGRLIGDGFGWSQFSLPGALTQIAMSVLVAPAGVLAIHFALTRIAGKRQQPDVED